MADTAQEIAEMCLRARRAARAFATTHRAKKNDTLISIARRLRASNGAIIEANKHDLREAEAGGTRGALLDRLMLDEARIVAIAKAVEEIANLADPVGETVSSTTRPNGLRIS